MFMSDERTKSSNFDSLMPINASLDNLTIFLHSSILGNKLLTLGGIKWIGVPVLKFRIWGKKTKSEYKNEVSTVLHKFTDS